MWKWLVMLMVTGASAYCGPDSIICKFEKGGAYAKLPEHALLELVPPEHSVVRTRVFLDFDSLKLIERTVSSADSGIDEEGKSTVVSFEVKLVYVLERIGKSWRILDIHYFSYGDKQRPRKPEPENCLDDPSIYDPA